MAKSGFKILDSDMHIMEPPDLWERYIDSNSKRARRAGSPAAMCAICAWFILTAGSGRARRRARTIRRAGKTSKEIKACTAQTPSAVGRRKCSSKRWTSKASTLPCSTRLAVYARWSCRIWTPSSPPRLRALTTTGFMIFAKKIPSV